MEPRSNLVRPEEPPKREPGEQFVFDKRSKIAQEIQKKYRKNTKPAETERIEEGYQKSSHQMSEARVKSNEKDKHNFNKAQKTTGRLDKENPPTYMKATATTGLRAARKEEDLPPKVRKVAMEQENKIKEQCTFKPKISVSPFSAKLELNKEERRSRLYKPKTTEIQKREKLKQQKDEEEFANICTFQPKRHIQSTSFIEVKARANVEEMDEPANERLFTEAMHRQEERRKVILSTEKYWHRIGI